jgi:hypothetical protein
MGISQKLREHLRGITRRREAKRARTRVLSQEADKAPISGPSPATFRKAQQAADEAAERVTKRQMTKEFHNGLKAEKVQIQVDFNGDVTRS